MTVHEVRIFAEGRLGWVNASATAGGWVTAAGAVSSTGPMGYVQAGFQGASAARIVTIMDRGNPSHHKHGGKNPVEVTFEFLVAATANDPALNNVTAGGASLPLKHFELKMAAGESTTAHYYQFHHGAKVDNTFTEGEDGNKHRQTWRFLSMTGPTASGYLA
jgi:hypothetical protein